MNNTDWKSLRLLNGGPATRVPELVKQLRTKPRALEGGRTDLLEEEAEEKRANALVILRQGLVAKGQWCSASLPAAELLIELAVSDGPGRPQALALLADILCGDHRRAIGVGPQVYEDSDAQSVSGLLRSRSDELLSCLTASDSRLREAAGPLVAFLPALDMTKVVHVFAHETDPRVRASLMLALVHQLDWPKVEELLDGASPGNDEEAGVGAVARLGWDAACDASAVGAALVDMLCQTKEGPAFAWAQGSYAVVLELVVENRGRGDLVLDALLAGLAARDDWTRCRGVTKPILSFAGFVARWPKRTEAAPPNELTDEQRRVAEAISSKEGLPWVGHGLPRSAFERLRWLGITPPGPLDRPVGPMQEPLWRALKKLSAAPDWDSEQVPELVEQLPALERIAVLGELCLNVYWAAADMDDDVLTERFEVEVRAHVRELGNRWVDFVDEVYNVTTPEYGQLPGLGGPFGQAIFYGLTANGIALKPEWKTLVPWGGSGVRELIGSLPRDFASDALYTRLASTYPERHMSMGVDRVLPLLDLVPTERLAELVLAKMLSKDGRSRVRDLEVALASLRDLAKSEPGIRAALQRHGALESTPSPWDA